LAGQVADSYRFVFWADFFRVGEELHGDVLPRKIRGRPGKEFLLRRDLPADEVRQPAPP
jgi:hypothetical protein